MYPKLLYTTSHPADISTTHSSSVYTVVEGWCKLLLQICHHAVPNEMDRLVNNSVRGWSRVQLCNGEIG